MTFPPSIAAAVHSGPLWTISLCPYTFFLTWSATLLASSFLFSGWISFHSPKSIATTKEVLGNFNVTCRCASRIPAQPLSTGCWCVCIKLGSCIIKNGKSSSANFTRQSLSIAVNKASYSPGRPAFDSPWYHKAPLKVRFLKGEIMELYIPVGMFWKDTPPLPAGISHPSLYFHCSDKRTVSPSSAMQ